MEDSIITKLRDFLKGDIDSECKVVYLLAETRKLLESYDPPPFSLNLHCNWALHVNLDRKGTTHAFLKQLDEYVASVFAGSTNVAAERPALWELASFDSFRQQFKQFLSDHQLHTAICDEDSVVHPSNLDSQGLVF
jgi:hypothetical protein